ncbi:hypothetical protein AB0Y20_09855 [Heyndrickxia oleronia]|uniref:hypothetical protein n=1 Tax=Heyndrickxia oleronia TaxID=38875 RepID=UPI003F1EA9AD
MRKKLVTTSSEGLMENSYPYRLYQKAKKFGVWNPQNINFSQDKEDWKLLSVNQKDWILKLLAQFQGGEEAVTLDLLPLLRVIARVRVDWKRRCFLLHFYAMKLNILNSFELS